MVVVAIIQLKSLKTEVGKGSMSTVFGHGLVGPKRCDNFVQMVWQSSDQAPYFEREMRQNSYTIYRQTGATISLYDEAFWPKGRVLSFS